MNPYPAPRSLRGIAQDLITQKNGGHPPTDDEPLREVQVIEWLVDAAAVLMQSVIDDAIKDDTPVPAMWYRPHTLPLSAGRGLADSYPDIRYKDTALTSLPATMLGEPLIKDLAITEGGVAIELVGEASQLARTARGWGRLPKSKVAGWLRGDRLVVALPERFWDTPTLYLSWVDNDPLQGVDVDDQLAVPRSWIMPLMQTVLKGPLAFTLGGVPDLVNDDAAKPAPSPAA